MRGEDSMSQDAKIGDWSDDRLIAEYRRLKDEMSGRDPRFHPGEENPLVDQVLAELEERGLAPDREDMVPDNDSESGAPEDNAPRP
jgi:hypothetical protein